MVTCRIVDAPDESARVLFDFESASPEGWLEAGSWLARDEDSPLGEAAFSNDLSDAEGTREIRLPLMIDGSRTEAEATKAALARELLSPSPRWLLWKTYPTSAPTWFRLRRDSSGALDFSRVYSDSEFQSSWRWNVRLVAEAFAYGARVEQTVQLQYRHFSGGSDTDVLSARLDDVKGDAPARLRVDVRPNGWMRGWSPWLNVTAVPDGSAWAGPTIWQAEEFTPATGYVRANIDYGGPDPTAGTPYNALLAKGTQSTAWAGARCLSGVAPSVPPPGRYVMMIRLISSSGQPCSPSFRWGVIAGPQEMLGTWSTWRKPVKYEPSINFSSWLNLGAFQLPAGMNTDGVRDGEIAPPTLTLWHRGDGSDVDVAVDRIMLMPAELADGATSNVQALAPFETWGSEATQTIRFDDAAHRVGIMTRDTVPRWVTNVPPKPAGQLPSVTPGLDNFVTLIPNVGTTGGTDHVFASKFDVTVSYHPRYLHLAGD